MAGGTFSGGNGTELTPYLVEDALDLNAVRNDLTAYYLQTANIDLNIAPYNEGEGWLPIGNATTKFTGSYNGDNKTISNMYINRTTSLNGLFGMTSSGVRLSNINLINVMIDNSGNECGCLLGEDQGVDYIIDNCHVAGSINSTISPVLNIGGLIGILSSTTTPTPIKEVSNCSSNVVLYAGVGNSGRIGGLIGYNIRNNVFNCYSIGSTYGSFMVGGLIGLVRSSDVSMCYSTCNISSYSTDRGRSGGLVGSFLGLSNVVKCFAKGNVIAQNTNHVVDSGIGGLIGARATTGTETIFVSQCYSTGLVQSGIGGNIGGLIGSGSGVTVTNSVYDSETSGQSDDDGRGIPKTTAEMKTLSTYTDLGWSF